MDRWMDRWTCKLDEILTKGTSIPSIGRRRSNTDHVMQ